MDCMECGAETKVIETNRYARRVRRRRECRECNARFTTVERSQGLTDQEREWIDTADEALRDAYTLLLDHASSPLEELEEAGVVPRRAGDLVNEAIQRTEEARGFVEAAQEGR